MNNISIRLFNASEVETIVDAFQKAHWPKPAATFKNYLEEQKSSKRLIWVAYVGEQLAGYITLKWRSDYEPFFTAHIPEIMDLNVLPQYRKAGVGSALLDMAENQASTKSNIIGIGVGLYGGSDGGYGAAQRLYISRRYVPDGKGVTYNYKYAVPGESYRLDDDLVLWFTKKVSETNMTNNKDHVYKSYEKIASWYDENRSRDLFEKSYLDMAIAHLKPDANVLDLGCGMGEPIAKYFIDKGFKVTGIDACEKLLSLAKSRYSTANFLVSDMRDLNLTEKFDCIIAWNSFFHLPKNDQRGMFKIFEKHINLAGILLFTTGSRDGEIWSDNGGESLYHASLDDLEYKKLLNAYKFEVITYKLEDKNCNDHSVWLAKYRGKDNEFPV